MRARSTLLRCARMGDPVPGCDERAFFVSVPGFTSHTACPEFTARHLLRADGGTTTVLRRLAILRLCWPRPSC